MTGTDQQTLETLVPSCCLLLFPDSRSEPRSVSHGGSRSRDTCGERRGASSPTLSRGAVALATIFVGATLPDASTLMPVIISSDALSGVVAGVVLGAVTGFEVVSLVGGQVKNAE